MKMQNINYTTTIEVSKPASEVFYHLLHDVSKFWPEEVVGETDNLNDEFVFRTGDSHYSKNKITDLTPNEKLVWLVIDSIRKTDNYSWTGTKMIFDLISKGNGTILKFTYDGVVPDDEQKRLTEICDFCIKDKLYNFIESFSATIEVAKSPQEVFNCISEVTSWWSKDFEGNSKQLDDEFIIHHPGQHYSKQKLIEVIPNKKMVWLVTESTLYRIKNDKHEWTNTKMIFEITTNNNKTILHFTHEGLVPSKECYDMCRNGWSIVIKNWLSYFITHGIESPEMSKAAEMRNKILTENNK